VQTVGLFPKILHAVSLFSTRSVGLFLQKNSHSVTSLLLFKFAVIPFMDRKSLEARRFCHKSIVWRARADRFPDHSVLWLPESSGRPNIRFRGPAFFSWGSQSDVFPYPHFRWHWPSWPWASSGRGHAPPAVAFNGLTALFPHFAFAAGHGQQWRGGPLATRLSFAFSRLTALFLRFHFLRRGLSGHGPNRTRGPFPYHTWLSLVFNELTALFPHFRPTSMFRARTGGNGCLLAGCTTHI